MRQSCRQGQPAKLYLSLPLDMSLSHVLPLQACLTITIIYGFFMVGAGAEFVGPLGISIVWAIYHAISPWLLVLYVFFPFKHEVRHKKVRHGLAALMRPRTCSLSPAWRCAGARLGCRRGRKGGTQSWALAGCWSCQNAVLLLGCP